MTEFNFVYTKLILTTKRSNPTWRARAPIETLLILYSKSNFVLTKMSFVQQKNEFKLIKLITYHKNEFCYTEIYFSGQKSLLS